VTYLSDRPYDEASPRRTETWLLQVMAGAKQRLLLENYAYTTQWGFMHDDRRKMFRDLLARGVSVEFLTNSLESRDSPIFFRSYPSEVNLVRKNMVITAVTGVSETPTDDPGLTPQIDQGATWGTHSKTACIDDRDCFVGSANLDPRSEDINAETGVIVNNNPAFAVAVESGIRHRELDAELLERSGNYQNTPRSQMQGDCPHDVGPTGAQIGNMDVLVRTMEDIGASRM
jgi:phosphatidylserine/phosphatidylglycerophosphate/cardiolipin synthase-like enzyme